MLLTNKNGRDGASLFISLLLKDGDCVKQFNSDNEIKDYIEKSIDSIKVLDECRLYREEQLQITEEVMRARNSIEWLIRINKVINNFIYAISRSYAYAVKMNWPLEETENSQMYAYYLEDAVYRDIVLWDLLRQFINEFFKCGYDKDREISIFSFLNDATVRRKLGNSEVKKIRKYLNSADHQEVRTKLRNQFTHSLDGTSSYLFHRNNNGKIQADMGNVFPKHPYENIVYVLDDIKKYLRFTPEVLSARQELMDLQRKLKKRERDYKKICELTIQWENEIKAWISVAVELGLLEENSKNMRFEAQMRLLQELVKDNTEEKVIRGNAIIKSSEEMVKLREKENELAIELTKYKNRYIEMTQLMKSVSEYRDALSIQVERLNITEWLDERAKREHICPI